MEITIYEDGQECNAEVLNVPLIELRDAITVLEELGGVGGNSVLEQLDAINTSLANKSEDTHNHDSDYAPKPGPWVIIGPATAENILDPDVYRGVGWGGDVHIWDDYSGHMGLRYRLEGDTVKVVGLASVDVNTPNVVFAFPTAISSRINHPQGFIAVNEADPNQNNCFVNLDGEVGVSHSNGASTHVPGAISLNLTIVLDT